MSRSKFSSLFQWDFLSLIFSVYRHGNGATRKEEKKKNRYIPIDAGGNKKKRRASARERLERKEGNQSNDV